MSFESGSVSFRIYQLPRDIPEPVLDGFASRTAPPMEGVKDQPVYGWVTGRHLLDRQIDEQNAFWGGYLRLCLLQAERKIPSSLLRAELKQEELIRLSISGGEHLSRRERTEMKQEIVDRLLPSMPPQLKGMSFVHRQTDSLLFAETLADKQVDVFVSYFREACGFAPIPLSPEALAKQLTHSDPESWPPCSFSADVEASRTSPLVGHDFMTWLWYQAELHPDHVPAGKEGEVGVMLEGPLTLVMEGGGAHELSLRKGNPTQSAEAKSGLLAGKKLRRATLNVVKGETVWRLTLDGETLAVRSFKPVMAESETPMDPASRFSDRMIQVEVISGLICGMFESFCKERVDPEAWNKRVKAMQNWIEERNVSF